MKNAMRLMSTAGFVAVALETIMKVYYSQYLLAVLWALSACGWAYVAWFNWKEK